MAYENVDLALVSYVEVASRLPYPVTDDHFKEVIEAVIVDASNLARFYGRDAWHASLVPPVVKTLVRNACVRTLILADGVTTSRAGDETDMYTDLRDRTGTVFFTDDEITTIREAAGRSGNFQTVTTYRHSPGGVGASNAAVYVPVAGGGKPLPMYSAGDPCLPG